MDIKRKVPSRLLQRIVHVLSRDVADTAGKEGLFEWAGGVIGAGDIDAPDVPARIEGFPTEARPENVMEKSIHVHRVRGSGFFGPMIGGTNLVLYEYLILLWKRTQPEAVDYSGPVDDDAFIHVRNVLTTGENPHVPGKLLDPDDTATEMNIDMPKMQELRPFKAQDLTAYPILVGYQCRENLRTGELA